jgi:hypothetical protein
VWRHREREEHDQRHGYCAQNVNEDWGRSVRSMADHGDDSRVGQGETRAKPRQSWDAADERMGKRGELSIASNAPLMPAARPDATRRAHATPTASG